MQFGIGPELAAQCQQALTPSGWRAWSDADGSVPEALARRAAAFAADQSVPLGSTESYPLPGVTTLIRIEPHAWGRDEKGALVQGCFRTGAIFLPAPEVSAPEAGKLDKIVGVLTAVSLAVGTAVTIATWKR